MPTKEFLATFTQAWNEADVDALMDHFHDEDCSFFTSVGFDVEGTKCVGREEVRKGCESLYVGYPDAHFEAVGEDFLAHAHREAVGEARANGLHLQREYQVGP